MKLSYYSWYEILGIIFLYLSIGSILIALTIKSIKYIFKEILGIKNYLKNKRNLS